MAPATAGVGVVERQLDSLPKGEDVRAGSSVASIRSLPLLDGVSPYCRTGRDGRGLLIRLSALTGVLVACASREIMYGEQMGVRMLTVKYGGSGARSCSSSISSDSIKGALPLLIALLAGVARSVTRVPYRECGEGAELEVRARLRCGILDTGIWGPLRGDGVVCGCRWRGAATPRSSEAMLA